LEDTLVGDATQLTPCDLLILATPDDLIGTTALRLAEIRPPVHTVAHLSGFASIESLAPLERVGMDTGCIHPLQTLPSPQLGAQALSGCPSAITARTERCVQRLRLFAQSLNMAPFLLEDNLKPLYHAGAATVALGLATVLGVAADLFEAASVPRKHAQPLAQQVMENCFQLGPDRSLTGPVVRGDRGTIIGHLQAATLASPSLARQYRTLGHLAALRAASPDQAEEIMQHFESVVLP
jgi:predicted short-subunit dehydrogenase-like oxidoreductase (DUF2520 family)